MEYVSVRKAVHLFPPNTFFPQRILTWCCWINILCLLLSDKSKKSGGLCSENKAWTAILKSINRLSWISNNCWKEVCDGGIRSSVICETRVCRSVSVARQPLRWGGRLRPFCSKEHTRPPWVGAESKGTQLAGDLMRPWAVCAPVPSPPPSTRSCLRSAEGLPRPGRRDGSGKGPRGPRGKQPALKLVSPWEKFQHLLSESLWHYTIMQSSRGPAILESTYQKDQLIFLTTRPFRQQIGRKSECECAVHMERSALLGLWPFCPGDSSSWGGAGVPRQTPPPMACTTDCVHMLTLTRRASHAPASRPRPQLVLNVEQGLLEAKHPVKKHFHFNFEKTEAQKSEVTCKASHRFEIWIQLQVWTQSLRVCHPTAGSPPLGSWVWGRVSQPRHWHLDQATLCWGAVLCTAGCSVESLTSPH